MDKIEANKASEMIQQSRKSEEDFFRRFELLDERLRSCLEEAHKIRAMKPIHHLTGQEVNSICLLQKIGKVQKLLDKVSRDLRDRGRLGPFMDQLRNGGFLIEPKTTIKRYPLSF